MGTWTLRVSPKPQKTLNRVMFLRLGSAAFVPSDLSMVGVYPIRVRTEETNLKVPKDFRFRVYYCLRFRV